MQAQGSNQKYIGGRNWKSSIRVFVVGEQVVEDSEGGLEVQVDNIWKTKMETAKIIRVCQTCVEEFQKEKLDL